MAFASISWGNVNSIDVLFILTLSTPKVFCLYIEIVLLIMHSFYILLFIFFTSVASSSNIWAEWVACGPLLVFITVALDHKSQLSRTDWVLMVSFAICTIAGFLIIIPGSYGVGVFLLSCVQYCPI